MHWAMFIESPIAATMLSILSAASGATVIMAARLLIRFARLEQAMKEIRDDVTDIKTDPDIVRWSLIGPHGTRISFIRPR